MKLFSEMLGLGASRVGAASPDSFQRIFDYSHVASTEKYQTVWSLIRGGRSSEGTFFPFFHEEGIVEAWREGAFTCLGHLLGMPGQPSLQRE